MILTGGNRSTGRSTCHSATLYTKNLSWTGLGSNLGLRDDRPAMLTTWEEANFSSVAKRCERGAGGRITVRQSFLRTKFNGR
jgi:hypothetical protein